jgi:CubicO group peptidase (beta-lactamase class C family)
MNKFSRADFDSIKLEDSLARMMDGSLNIHAVVIERHGQVVAERYRRGRDRSIYSLFAQNRTFGPATLHDTRSVGKSVIGLLMGIAMSQGSVQGMDVPVIHYYPEHADLLTPALRSITLEHLLTMSSGFDWQEGHGFPDNEHHLYWKRSLSRYVLSRNIASAPGEKFNYNSGGTALLADILTKVTKTSLKDFANEFLFEPLNIQHWEWIGDLHGRPMAFTGLRMCAQDMIKLGRLILNHGQWHGRQIVPADWVTASLQARIHTNFDELQYGYHWWTGEIKSHCGLLAWGAAFGNGGQRIYMLPELDMTIVILAGAYGDVHISRAVHGFFKDIILSMRTRDR